MFDSGAGIDDYTVSALLLTVWKQRGTTVLAKQHQRSTYKKHGRDDKAETFGWSFIRSFFRAGKQLGVRRVSVVIGLGGRGRIGERADIRRRSSQLLFLVIVVEKQGMNMRATTQRRWTVGEGWVIRIATTTQWVAG